MSARMTLTRRGLLAAGGAVALGAASGCSVATPATTSSAPGPATTGRSPSPSASSSASPTPKPTPTALAFNGPHQAGIETEPALVQSFVGLDLLEPGRDAATAALLLISDDAERLMGGRPALGDTVPELAAQPDQLSITLGLGRTIFTRAGLASRLPRQLAPFPSFDSDRFEEPWGQTDLLLQVGANDPVTLSHTLRTLTKDLSTVAAVRWIQTGFQSNAAETTGAHARRNLMGMVEGAHFPAPGTPEFAEVVWIDDGPDWAVGGTTLVLRRIRMLLDTWDRLDRPVQEQVIGRSMADGALLGADASVRPYDAVDELGLPIIPMDAHVRRARADDLAGTIMRRPYNYDAGMRDGTPDVGLLFAAYMRDPQTSFIPTQRRLDEMDAFQKWIRTIGSAVYVIPRGPSAGETLAQGAFA